MLKQSQVQTRDARLGNQHTGKVEPRKQETQGLIQFANLHEAEMSGQPIAQPPSLADGFTDDLSTLSSMHMEEVNPHGSDDGTAVIPSEEQSCRSYSNAERMEILQKMDLVGCKLEGSDVSSLGEINPIIWQRWLCACVVFGEPHSEPRECLRRHWYNKRGRKETDIKYHPRDPESAARFMASFSQHELEEMTGLKCPEFAGKSVSKKHIVSGIHRISDWSTLEKLERAIAARSLMSTNKHSKHRKALLMEWYFTNNIKGPKCWECPNAVGKFVATLSVKELEKIFSESLRKDIRSKHS